ncbi:hypothetical protein D9757_003031 [Collybiopsis confluens]|uniref:Aminotransferase class V domain-containing protein n=1 Tax=Collybiopsis confluens TaxID=2823264 RepID=A0A8H5HX53_9AGAR|nr:hypothetical protein D9757_003031 [Collybiopsis confluens]
MGGSQVALNVANKINEYLLNANVQFGADYSISVESTRRVFEEAPEAAVQLFNANSPEEVVFGFSTTMNFENLARALDDDVQTGDEIILTWEHEANNGPWKKLARRRNATVKYWKPSPTNTNNSYSVKYKVEELIPLITSKTRILAFSACSNILGSILPIKDIVKAARKTAKEAGSPKFEISIDCVAYAPHRLIDVTDWDLYGAHNSALYVRLQSLRDSLSQIGHHFLKVAEKPLKLQFGGPGYELVYGSTGTLQYLRSLTAKQDLRASFDVIAIHEQQLVSRLLAFLTHPTQFDRGVRIVGEETLSMMRVPTISFVVVGEKAVKSSDIVRVCDKKGDIGIRFGHFYAYSLIDLLEPKLDTEDGVVRISLVHYNTVEEVDRIIIALEEALA